MLGGEIQNLGVIDVAEGGYAVLSADKVVNEGVIGARLALLPWQERQLPLIWLEISY